MMKDIDIATRMTCFRASHRELGPSSQPLAFGKSRFHMHFLVEACSTASLPVWVYTHGRGPTDRRNQVTSAGGATVIKDQGSYHFEFFRRVAPSIWISEFFPFVPTYVFFPDSFGNSKFEQNHQSCSFRQSAVLSGAAALLVRRGTSGRVRNGRSGSTRHFN